MLYLDGLRSLMQRLELVGDDMRQAPITRALYCLLYTSTLRRSLTAFRFIPWTAI